MPIQNHFFIQVQNSIAVLPTNVLDEGFKQNS
jgi:hypothetical protein